MDIEREKLEADVIFVGAGPACLAGAIRLQNQIEAHNEKADSNPSIKPIEDPSIVIIEKGSEVGSHGISGAVLDPKQAEEVNKDFQDGQSVGVTGTPAFFVNGVMLSGAVPFAQFKEIIDRELGL